MIRLPGIVCCSMLTLFAIQQTSAQSPEFSFSAGAGISGLKYAMNQGSSTLQPGFRAAFGYTWFINNKWGLSTGMELGYYHTKASLTNGEVFTSNITDTDGEGFEHRVQTKGYHEQQKLYALNIPLLVQFHIPPAKNTQWYAKGGLKISIPVSAAYAVQADELTAAAYYPNLNLEITDLPAHGFGSQANWKGSGHYSFNPSVSLVAETGARFRTGNTRLLYAGAFIEYGLNNIKQEQDISSLISYNYATLANSKANGIFSVPAVTGNVRLLSYGIRISYSFTGR